MEFENLEAIVDFAIQKEREAAEFYQQISNDEEDFSGSKKMFAEFAQEEKNMILITNVNVWDGLSAKAKSADVLIEGNKVASISAEAVSAPGATVIEGNGRTLMPGLIDMHTHVMFPQGLPEGVVSRSRN
mgnify:CR=1 FL=1